MEEGDNGGALDEKEQQQPIQSANTKITCPLGRYIAQCFLGALATFCLTLFIDLVLLSHDAIVGGALLGFGVGLFGAGVAIAIAQIALHVIGYILFLLASSKQEQAREAGQSATNTEPLCGQCVRENGRFLMKKSLAMGINEPCLGEAPPTPPGISECFDLDKAPGCAPIDTVGQGTLIGVYLKAYVLPFDLFSSTTYAIATSCVHKPAATICQSVDYITKKSTCNLSEYLAVSEDTRTRVERNANSQRPVPWYGGPDTLTSKQRYDMGVTRFLNENGGDTAENRQIAKNLNVDVANPDPCVIS